MAQSLVTYLGGATKSSEWLRAAADPAAAIHFFDDGFSAGAFSADTSLDGAGVGGRITASPGTTTTSTTSAAVLFSGPSKVAFECKGQFDGDGTGGLVGISAVSANGKTNIASDEGAYFYVDGTTLKFRVRTGTGAGDHQTIDVADITGIIDGVEHRFGFAFDSGKFMVYLNGAMKGDIDSAFPAGDMRFASGKRDAVTAKTNQFVSFDYVLVSADR